MHGYEVALAADVRAHSLLGLAASRSGDVVTIHGSVRSWNTALHHYRPWTSPTVAVQRWTSAG